MSVYFFIVVAGAYVPAQADKGPITIAEVKRNLVIYHRDLLKPNEAYPEEEIQGPKVLLRYKERAFPAYHELLLSKRTDFLSKAIIFKVLRHVDADISEFLPVAREFTTDKDLKRYAVELLGRIGKPEDATLLVSLLPDGQLRSRCLDSLEKIGLPEHAQLLDQIAENPPFQLDREGRDACRKAASVIRGKHQK